MDLDEGVWHACQWNEENELLGSGFSTNVFKTWTTQHRSVLKQLSG
jgi:hypothetical protein